jgi:hypothetical protein
MINIINDLGESDETIYDVGQTEKIIAEPGSRGRHVHELQQRLIEFGYEINERELINQKFGDNVHQAAIQVSATIPKVPDITIDDALVNSSEFRNHYSYWKEEIDIAARRGEILSPHHWEYIKSEH